MDEEREAEDSIKRCVVMYELHLAGVSTWEFMRKHYECTEAFERVYLSYMMGPGLVKCHNIEHHSGVWEV